MTERPPSVRQPRGPIIAAPGKEAGAFAVPRALSPIQRISALVACRYFSCLVAVKIPRADDHFNFWYDLLVSVAPFGCGALLLEISRRDFDQ